MSKLGDREDFVRNMNYKSVMKVGNSMIDVKSSIGWTYERDDEEDGYLLVMFIYPSGTVISAKLRNRQDFYQFLIETETYMDDSDVTMPDMKKFVRDIEKDCNISENGKTNTLYTLSTSQFGSEYDTDDEEDEF